MASADITDVVEQDFEPSDDQQFQTLLGTKVIDAFAQANSSKSVILNVQHYAFTTARQCFAVLASLAEEEKASFEEALLHSAEASLS